MGRDESGTMARLAIVTPTYAPDFDMFRELHESVLRFVGDNVTHQAIVPARDVPLFSTIRSSRLAITAVDDLLPRRYRTTYALARRVRSTPGLGGFPPIQAVNLRRPWPPIRGWILQQVVKLEAAGSIDADVVLAVDSDVSFIKALTPETFFRDGTTRLYRKSNAIHADMPEHLAWHATARRLLGLPSAGSTVAADYIAPMVALDPRLMRSLQDRIESAQGRCWLDALTSELHFSEYILYGLYLDNLAPAPARSFSSDRSLCHSRWGSEPFGFADVDRFLDSLSEDDVAIHLQSTSQADPAVRRVIVEAARERFVR
jgi:hypothetical protein